MSGRAPLVEGPGTFLWAQFLGYGIAFLLLCSTILSWGLAMEPTDAPCPTGERCFVWTRLWMSPELGITHALLGLLALVGAQGLRQGKPRSAWLFALPDVYLILYGATWMLLGMVYAPEGLAWLILPGLMLPVAVAHVTFLAHPATRRFLRRVERSHAGLGED